LPNGTYQLFAALEAGGERLEELALGSVSVGGRPHVFVVPPLEMPAQVTFGGVVQLAGLETAPIPSTRLGDTIVLPLVWQVLAPTDRPLVRFVHLLGADGRPLAQADGIACAGACPADTWVAGEVLEDDVNLLVGLDTPPGEYTLAVGWYDGETLQRLDVQGGDGATPANGLLPFAVVEVMAP
jgi:hypothetical protein